ncbi:excinuclease ABC subunit UvrC [Collinsella sp. AGMB00827]|uniref:UvrABC system protein C n=1 Tax=Collinsella ureilytica TaxID=2869515 RepID=A0ABS7MI69_9ACTN|nr:excinuclease ABC subunit UvrC [Collinsella urealyticum]MBY4797067.1 excinuclease ABC subunit UvrC [Collinsella urealyticum]
MKTDEHIEADEPAVFSHTASLEDCPADAPSSNSTESAAPSNTSADRAGTAPARRKAPFPFSHRAAAAHVEQAGPGGAPSLVDQVARVPAEPGCYLWRDAAGEVIYVGKAKNLRARMRQYVTLSDDRDKIPLMMQVVASFDYLVVDSEHEALVLERNLIAQYHPYFNVDFKDDKSYPFIAVTKGDVFPAIKYTRERHRAGTRYFGPYTDARAARATIDTLRRVIPICSGTCAEWRRVRRMAAKAPEDADIISMLLAEKGRPCFDYHVGRGPGACVGAISPEEYADSVRRVERFLAGKRSEVIHELTDEMETAAQNLDFERAARVKRRLEAISALNDRQQVVFPTDVDLDLIGFYREETIAGACVFCVREGRTVRSAEFILDKGLDVSVEELTAGFLKRYYDETADIPAEVGVGVELDDAEVIGEWLTSKRGRVCHVRRPQRGEKRHLLDTCERNARHALMRYMMRTGYADDRTNRALLELESALALPSPPLHIECFDISTLHGSFTVASMVVFTNGRADKSQYRRFKIRAELEEANDFLSMQEVLGRRYAPDRMADTRFGARPDLLVVDGGKPQLSAALSQLEALGLDIPVCGLAKSDEEVFVPWSDTPVILPGGSASLYLIKQVRDESHRFAITFHRELRDKAMTASVLDEVPGVGPARKRSLMAHFGSMKRLRDAEVEDIARVKGIPADVAQAIYDILRA